jgi:hypothetical protein
MRPEVLALDEATEMPVFVGEPQMRIDKWKAIWNIGKNQPAAVVSKGYELIQHRDVAESFLDACGRLNLKVKANFKTAGHRAYMDIEFPETRIGVGLNEEFVLGFRIVNSYDKTTGIIILPRLVRLICLNGMVVDSKNFVRAYNYRHNQDMAQHFEQYIEVALAEMVNSNEKFKTLVNGCIGESVEWAVATELLKELFKTDKHREAITAMLAEKPSVTRWDIYNAITRYATHGEQLTPNVENLLQKKANRVLNKPCMVILQEQRSKR